MTEQERAELDVRLARMFSKPNRSEVGGHFFLLWMEQDDSGSPQTMVWRPETEAEIRAATLFYDAAHERGDFAKPVQKGKPIRRASEHDAMIKAILQNREDDTGYLANLKKLQIGFDLTGSNLLFGLFRSPHVKRLTELDLGGITFNQENARLFGTAAFSSTLTHLDLDSATFESGAFGAFAHCELPALQSLKLNSVHLRAAEIGLLGQWLGRKARCSQT